MVVFAGLRLHKSQKNHSVADTAPDSTDPFTCQYVKTDDGPDRLAVLRRLAAIVNGSENDSFCIS